MTAGLPRRLAEHRAGRGAQWTARRRPVELAFALEGLDYRAAREVERYVSPWVARDARMLALVRKRTWPAGVAPRAELQRHSPTASRACRQAAPVIE
jgi:predicted GIY-YIG superfamily endonuclease